MEQHLVLKAEFYHHHRRRRRRRRRRHHHHHHLSFLSISVDESWDM